MSPGMAISSMREHLVAYSRANPATLNSLAPLQLNTLHGTTAPLGMAFAGSGEKKFFSLLQKISKSRSYFRKITRHTRRFSLQLTMQRLAFACLYEYEPATWHRLAYPNQRDSTSPRADAPPAIDIGNDRGRAPSQKHGQASQLACPEAERLLGAATVHHCKTRTPYCDSFVVALQ